MPKEDLAALFLERIASGLARKSITTASRWAETYRFMGPPIPGRFSFKYHPWSREMLDSGAEMNIGQKSAQMGFTEVVLNLTFFNIDVKGVDCLYILPAKTPDAGDFSSGRFNSALEFSTHLAKLFSDVKNVGHKRAGKTNLYIRGSRSRSGLKSVPVGFIVLDELDEMTQKNVPLVLERASGQFDWSVWMLSTPTIEHTGINSYYESSSQNHFFFNCPHCSKQTELVFPESLIITAKDLNDPQLQQSHLICKECKGILDHESKYKWLAEGKWVEGHADRESKGWYINQLYSSTVRPAQIAELYLQSLSDKTAEQEFYNSKLGLPHAVEGSKVTEKHITNCIASYKNGENRPASGLITMGVDVGSFLHYEIDEWFLPERNMLGGDINIGSRCKMLRFGKVRDFEELDLLMFDWMIRFCVIDAQPERRKALEFANRFYGRVRLCFYPEGAQGKVLKLNDEEQTVSVDRTTWLDTSLGRIKRGKPWMFLPGDIDMEWKSQIKANVRLYKADKHGNPIGRYVKADSDADHYAHARTYSEIALPLATGLGVSQNIS